jgi:uncharacterized protein YidB (DUF937 family)
MNILSFNNEFECNAVSEKDILSAFKRNVEKNLTIQQGMSVNEIAEIVSEKIILLVNEQFQNTKEQFQNK